MPILSPAQFGDWTPDDSYDAGDRELKEAGLFFRFAVWDLAFIDYVRRLREAREQDG